MDTRYAFAYLDFKSLNGSYEKSTKISLSGFGLGLRPEHYEEILQQKPDVDWFEIITENYLIPGGKPLYYLDQGRENYPVVMHGVSLSIGSTDPLDRDYLKQVKALAERIEPDLDFRSFMLDWRQRLKYA